MCRPLLDKISRRPSPDWRPPGGLHGISNCLRSRRSTRVATRRGRHQTSVKSNLCGGDLFESRGGRPQSKETKSHRGDLLLFLAARKKKQKKGAQGHADAQIKRSQLSGGFSFFEKRIRVGGCHLADASGEKTKEKRKEGRSGT